jgi:predicted phosphodiesterase
MKIFVVSDLHLEASETLGTFGWDQNEFIAKMESIRKSYSIDKVVLNGDTFDMCKSPYERIVEKNKKLLDYLREIKAVFIKGNHDNGLAFGQKHFGVINSKGEKVFIEHGHQGDFINGTAAGRLMGKLFYQLLKCATRIPFIQAWYYGYLERDEGFKGHRKYDSYKYLRHAVNLHKKYDVVILGHTHKMEHHNTFSSGNFKRYFNSGSCSFGRFQGIVLDTETLAHKTIRFDPPHLSTARRQPASRPHRRVPIISIRPATGSGIFAPA